VYGWTSGGTGELIPGLAEVPWAGRTAYVCFDFDPKPESQANVAGAAFRLAAALKKAGAGRVRFVLLPPGPAKVGVDDFVVARGAEAYLNLVKVARPYLPGQIHDSCSSLYRENTEHEFPAPVLSSQLKAPAGEKSLLAGCLSPGMVTLLAGLWKAGKTTWLSVLLKAMEKGGLFCGLAAEPCRVLYVTEEDERLWVGRRDRLGIGDHVAWQVRPFLGKPTWAEWYALLAHVAERAEEHGAGLVVFDTLSNLWPVLNENDQGEVQRALMPIHRHLTPKGLAVLLGHHLRKADGQEATGSRGSGALTSFVDTILELRRHAPAEKADRRRVLTGYSRLEGAPQDLVIELSADGLSYEPLGDRQEVQRKSLREVLPGLLPRKAPGTTAAALLRSSMPLAVLKVTERALRAELRRGAAEGLWNEAGTGKKKSPFTYWQAGA
jgi:hypothetical protein